jgi:hypothetical protein
MKKIVILVLLISWAPVAGLAAGRCAADKAKFCNDVENVDACLNQHMDKLSADCKTKLEGKQGAPLETPPEGEAKQ